MNGPKVNVSLALVKLSYMRETPPKLFGTRCGLDHFSNNPADMGTIRREDLDVPGTLRDYTLGNFQ